MQQVTFFPESSSGPVPHHYEEGAPVARAAHGRRRPGTRPGTPRIARRNRGHPPLHRQDRRRHRAGSGIGRATALRPAAEGTSATGIEAPVGSDLFPGRMAGFMRNAPCTATAEQVAAVIVFLASDDASNVNGVIMPSDGGWSAV